MFCKASSPFLTVDNFYSHFKRCSSSVERCIKRRPHNSSHGSPIFSHKPPKNPSVLDGRLITPSKKKSLVLFI
ncbi:hypothetical protein QVD17_13566 [Tagetes erecta]|uniref:Uncharacterized protein n=1 Tax=Tagetes erecta TaxID=13708 RepID=A0AAD8KX76_TARER|nr:hypothetical protein QVD17_13566 [Tagetes erecta]